MAVGSRPRTGAGPLALVQSLATGLPEGSITPGPVLDIALTLTDENLSPSLVLNCNIGNANTPSKTFDDSDSGVCTNLFVFVLACDCQAITT